MIGENPSTRIKWGDHIKTRRKKWGCRLLSALFFTLVAEFSGGMSTGTCQDVVFLLDTSQSMNDSDGIRVAPDSIRAMVSSLEATDKAGVIGFNTEVTMLRPLSPAKSAPLDLSGITYEGYTNTGAAVESALQALGQENGTERSIVLVTDGEIMMPGADATLHSSQLFAAGMETASRQGIPVYILSIQEGPEEKDYHLYTGYARVEPVAIGDLLWKARELAHRDLHAGGIALPVEKQVDSTGRITKLSAELPLPEAEGVRFLFFSQHPGRVSLTGDSPGPEERIRELYVNHPASSHFEFPADYPQDCELKLDAIPDVDGMLLVEAESSWWGDRATIRVTPVSKGEPSAKLLGDKSFDGKTVHLMVDGVETQGRVDDGVILVDAETEDEKSVVVEDVRFEELGIHFLGTNRAEVPREKNRLLAWLLAGLGMAIIAILFWLQGKKKTEEISSRKEGSVASPVKKPLQFPPLKLPEKLKPKPEPSRIPEPELEPEPSAPPRVPFYRGKLVLYVTHAPDDSDLAPLEYNLFRRAKGKEITVADVLAGCGVKLDFPGAENITLGPLKYGIYVLNRSDCTITKRNDILIKGSQAEMYFDESIHIAFTDEKSEMILMYKNLKPKEH